VFWTCFATLNGGIFFREFFGEVFLTHKLYGFVSGIVVIFMGVYLLAPNPSSSSSSTTTHLEMVVQLNQPKQSSGQSYSKLSQLENSHGYHISSSNQFDESLVLDSLVDDRVNFSFENEIKKEDEDEDNNNVTVKVYREQQLNFKSSKLFINKLSQRASENGSFSTMPSQTSSDFVDDFNDMSASTTTSPAVNTTVIMMSNIPSGNTESSSSCVERRRSNSISNSSGLPIDSATPVPTYSAATFKRDEDEYEDAYAVDAERFINDLEEGRMRSVSELLDEAKNLLFGDEEANNALSGAIMDPLETFAPTLNGLMVGSSDSEEEGQ
jgi:hypothetical protein